MKTKLLNCKFCGGKLPLHNKVFCTILCSTNYIRSTKNAKKLKIECSNCKTLIFKTKKYIEATKNPTCSRSCAATIRSKLTSGIKKSPETIAKQNLAKTKNKIIKYGVFECKKCKKEFPSNTSLRGHHGWCNNKNIKAKCEACGKKFSNTTSCKIHQKMWCEVLVPQKKKALCEKLSAALYQNVQMQIRDLRSLKEKNFFEKLQVFFPDATHGFLIAKSMHQYDICIPSLKLIIEYDGNYWHGNPMFYKTFFKFQIVQQKKDYKQSCFAVKNGYNLHRVWENTEEEYLAQLKENIQNGDKALKDFIDTKNWKDRTDLRHTGEDQP